MRGCRDLGTMVEAGQGGVARDDVKAASLYKQACSGAETVGCNALAVMLGSGRGGQPKDDAKAVELYRKGCDGGDLRACTNLGVSIDCGLGTLLSSEIASVTITCRTLLAGSLTNVASLASPVADPVAANNFTATAANVPHHVFFIASSLRRHLMAINQPAVGRVPPRLLGADAAEARDDYGVGGRRHLSALPTVASVAGGHGSHLC